MWEVVPIKMFTGWSANWCNLFAVFDENRNIVQFNDSEDIVWFTHLREPWTIDAGFYQGDKLYSTSTYDGSNRFGGDFVIRFLVITEKDKELMDAGAKDWCDCIVKEEWFREPMAMVQQLEKWMETPPISR